MEKLTTQFGEIDLTVDRIEIPISDSPFGFKRSVCWEEIPFLSETGQYAEIVWVVKTKDNEGNLIAHPDIRSERRVSTIISSENRVDLNGITIKREAFPEGESGEQKWLDARSSGINEYQFYRALINQMPLPEVLKISISILDQYKTFDR